VARCGAEVAHANLGGIGPVASSANMLILDACTSKQPVRCMVHGPK
jgi:hypothetical protein